VRQCKIQGIPVAAFLVFLFLPIMTMALSPDGHRAGNAQLAGIVSSTEFPCFSVDGWLSGRYQKNYAEAFSKIFGLRACLIRISNQVYYTVFRKSYMYDQNLIVGREEMLFEKGYLLEYCGLSSVPGDEVLQGSVDKLMLLQKKLADRGIVFAVLITPSKASIYPENIPDTFRQQKKMTLRMYDKMLSLFTKAGVRFVDGHALTLVEKARERGPVFGKGGTHWTHYAASFSVDRLIVSLEEGAGQVLPHLVRSNVHLESSARAYEHTSDEDLAKLLNLLTHRHSVYVPAATYTRDNATLPRRKTILFMGDSFTWNLLDVLHEGQIFQQMDFYYYYSRMKASYVAGQEHTVELKVNVKKIQWDKEIFNHDFLVLSLNEIYLKSDYVDAFVDDALKNLQ
jgi:alginate O-acetyltransferase complex protein AlgJ